MKQEYSNFDILMIFSSISFTVIGFKMMGENNNGWWVGVFFGACSLALIFKPLLSKRIEDKTKETVVFDNKVLKRIVGGKATEQIEWSKLVEIGIQTTDEGPYVDDIFWLFIEEGRKSGCVIPSEAQGFSMLLEHIQKFPNFKNDVLVKAMGSVNNANFKVWEAEK